MASIKRIHRTGCTGGACECPWRLDHRPQGASGPRRRRDFPTKKAAEQYLAGTRVCVARGEYVDPARIPSFRAVAEEWLREKSGRHPSTVQGWRVHVRHLNKLEPLRLDKIGVAKIEEVRDELAATLSAKTIAKVMTTCAAIFKLAIRRSYASANPAAIAERPRREVTELDDQGSPQSESGLRAVRTDEVLSPVQIKKLLENSDPGLFRTLFATVAATGLRPEEAYALKWSDLSLSQGQLFVRRSLSWARSAEEEKGRVRPKFFEPKTRAGYRTLPLPTGLVSALKVWKLQSPPSECDLVFCRADGQPLHRSTVLRQGLYPALERAKLPHANVKTLRHSYASGLILSGAPVTEVQHRLGHSDPSVTLRVYSHWYSDEDSGAVDRFASEFIPDEGVSDHASSRNLKKVDTKWTLKRSKNSV